METSRHPSDSVASANDKQATTDKNFNNATTKDVDSGSSTDVPRGARNELNLVALSQQPSHPSLGDREMKPVDAKPKTFQDKLLDFSNKLLDNIFGCEPNPIYEEALELAAETYLDQSKGEQIRKGSGQNACESKTHLDAVKQANKVLDLTGDPFTMVLPKEIAEAVNNDVAGDLSFSGIGVELLRATNPNDKQNIVGEVYPGSPAEKAGLQPGDRILSIDGKPTNGMKREDILNNLDGKEGSKVSIKVDRDGKMIDANATRGEYIDPATVSKMVDGTLYLKLKDFMNDHTDTELKKALEQNPDAKSYIVDLRGNGGGRLDEMLQTIGLFMDKGTLMNEEVKIPYRSQMEKGKFVLREHDIVQDKSSEEPVIMPRQSNLTGNKQLIVLTDNETASASELFAGAIKDNNRGLILGDKTYGKGVGQSVYTIADDAMLLVTSTKFTTPNGTWAGDGNTKKFGIEPDIVVSRDPANQQYVPGSKDDMQFQYALDKLRAR